jgi:hypothetical protein
MTSIRSGGYDSTSEDEETERLDCEVARRLRRVLARLASEQETAAAQLAAVVPYWKPCPDSVIGFRAAARVLREAAESFSGAAG